MTSKLIKKNKKIAESKRQTILRHSKMNIKTFDVKIQENRLFVNQKEALERIFLEQKWYKNYILNWSEKSPDNKISKFDIKQTHITKKDKDMNDVEVDIKYLSAQSRQCLLSRMIANIKTLSTLKKKGIQKVGKIKYSKEETIIDFKQFGTSHKIITPKKIKLQGIPKTLTVNGLEQFIDIEGIEIANARLIRRATGYYVQFVCYVPKKEKEDVKIDEILGVDFGCMTSFTTSKGEKISVVIQESGRLKRLQKQLTLKTKGSKNWLKLVQKIRKIHQRIINEKNDQANKIVYDFCKYRVVVIQDEQLRSWSKNGHGKAIQHSILGRVKAKLFLKPNVVVLNRFVPTTKLCTNCGVIHDGLKVWDRTFKCECGVEMDRDVHAAKNMVWCYENNVGVGHTEVKRREIDAMVKHALVCETNIDH